VLVDAEASGEADVARRAAKWIGTLVGLVSRAVGRWRSGPFVCTSVPDV
jgi:hypothetical protein